MLKLLDLFSGIGGFSLGLERTGGFETVAFCEIDKFCQKVLRKHWPNVRQYQDVTKLTAAQLTADGITVDAICGGFPCQDISLAGGGQEWAKAHAADYGASTPVLLANYDHATSSWKTSQHFLGEGLTVFSETWPRSGTMQSGIAYRLPPLVRLTDETGFGLWRTPCAGDAERGVYASREKMDARLDGGGATQFEQSSQASAPLAHADNLRKLQPQGCKQNQRGWLGNSSWWDVEPNVGRVANGVPARVDRLKSLGNAVVPQIPELIGRAILSSDATLKAKNHDH